MKTAELKGTGMKGIAIKSSNSMTWLEEGGQAVEGLISSNLETFPMGEDSRWACEGPAMMRTFEDRMAAMTIKSLFGVKWDGRVHRIAGISLPDKLKGRGWGKAMVMARMQFLGKHTALYNSQASPEFAAVNVALARDGLVELLGNPRQCFALILTESGERHSPFSGTKEKPWPPRWTVDAHSEENLEVNGG